MLFSNCPYAGNDHLLDSKVCEGLQRALGDRDEAVVRQVAKFHWVLFRACCDEPCSLAGEVRDRRHKWSSG
eukprot:1196250-Prorocentrum_minimum.AAC.4